MFSKPQLSSKLNLTITLSRFVILNHATSKIKNALFDTLFANVFPHSNFPIRRYEPQIFRTLELNYNILFSDMYLEWGGGDFSTLGYIFHGQDEFYNLEHEPVSEKVSFTLFLNQLWIQRRINYYRLLRRLSMSYFEF